MFVLAPVGESGWKEMRMDGRRREVTRGVLKTTQQESLIAKAHVTELRLKSLGCPQLGIFNQSIRNRLINRSWAICLIILTFPCRESNLAITNPTSA